ncbi:tetratricopeptide repeat protein 27-like [Babylonia areolata]|uniref:tetratricopeptide repeat protein 27-like n=1 Tax=Babylonia areolata TaxID=304850 RepID=UPI003FCF8E7F
MEFSLEIALVTGDKFRKSIGDVSIPESVASFLDASFEVVLRRDSAKQILCENVTEQRNLEVCILKNVEHFLSAASGDDKASRELEVLVTGAACLQLFVQNNWVGPPTSTPPSAFLAPSFSDDKTNQESALSYLSEDGEEAYNLSQFAAFLQLARIIFLDCRQFFSSLQTWDWWLARCLMVQQSLLDQKSPTLRATILEALELVAKKESLIHDEANRDVAVLFHIEASHMCLFYWEDKMSSDHVTKARKLASLDIELTGALGKRTRFQQDDKAQLIVKVTRNEEEHPLLPVGLCDPEFSAAVPKSLLLDDDTVLDKIQFKDEETNVVTQLSPLEQALLFAVMESHRRALARERLTDEETLTYLQHIIGQVSSWPVSVSALTLRSRLEKDSRRRVERSMQQMEELVNQTQRPDPPPAVRLRLFYAAQPKTIWAIQSQLASLLLSLGCVGAALSIFERLQLWEDAIACYQQMGKKEKAESVIREQLAVKETPTLLCFLGDVTCNKAHYERAWELSKHRSARAVRCLGYINFREEKYEEAVKCFEKSLEINALQIPVWFTCGCACLTAKKYESAVRAFKRCVNIDYDNFEAWSNLATAYARLQKKRMAFLTLKDAIKCNYENWRLWENCLLFATDCGEFDEAIRAYSRMLDLKDKFSDTEVLGILVKVVVTNMEDAEGNPAGRLLYKLLQLFGRITSKLTANSETWKLYADLCLVDTPEHPADQEKAAEFLGKSHHSLTMDPNWERLPEDCEKVAKRVLELTKAYKTCIEQMENSQKAMQLLNKAKFSLKGVVSAIRLKHTDPATKELAEPLNTTCLTLDQELQSVMDQLQQLRTM